MNFKKLLSLAAAAAIAAGSFAAMAVTASAADVNDLTVISSNTTFIAQDETTAALTKDTLSWNGKLLTLNGDNAYSTSKGYSVLNGTQVQNLLQVKQGRNMAVKVSGACTIDVYHDDYSPSRVIQAGSTNKGTEYTVTQAVAKNETTNKNYDIDTITVPAAGVVYIGASGDVYVAAIDVKFAGETPVVSEAPTVPTEAPTTAPTEAPTTAPTEAPATQAEMKIGDNAVFTDYAKDYSVKEGEILSDYVKVTNTGKVSIGSSNKTVDGVSYTKVLKSGGSAAHYTVVPAESGTLQIVAVTGKSGEARTFYVNGNPATTGDAPAVYEFAVTKGETVTITFANNVGIYGIKLIATPTTEKSYAFTKTIKELGDIITVIVNGSDSEGSFSAEGPIEKETKFSGEGDLKLGIILNVPDGMTVSSVTIK